MPSRSEVHVDAALSNFAVKLGQMGFIADVVFPPVPVVKESDKYFKFGAEHLNAEYKTERAPGHPATEIEWSTTTASYECIEHALKHLLPDRIVANADTPIRPRQRTSALLSEKIRLGIEKRVKDLLVDTSTYSNSTPSTKWDAASGVTIEKDIDDAKEAFAKASGFEPSHILIPPAVAKIVKRDSSIRDLVRYTDATILVNGDLPPALFNMQVVIPGAIANQAKPGLTASVARVWSTDDVVLLYVNPTPGVDAASAGYQFRVSQAGLDVAVRSWREEDRGGEMIEASVIQAEAVVSAECGYIINDVLT